MSVQNKPLPFLNQQKFGITKSASGRTRNLNTIMRIGRKAAEGRRSPRREAFASDLRIARSIVECASPLALSGWRQRFHRRNQQTPIHPFWQRQLRLLFYSHSIVPGGLLVMSKTQRFTPFTSLMMRPASFSINSYGNLTQSAVMPSCDSTARMAMV